MRRISIHAQSSITRELGSWNFDNFRSYIDITDEQKTSFAQLGINLLTVACLLKISGVVEEVSSGPLAGNYATSSSV